MAMETQNENKICIVDKTVDAKDQKPWLSKDNCTLESATVKLMISIVVSSTVSMIAFLLKNARSYTSDIMCYIYTAVILLWIALMSVIFFRFMWNGILKDKQQHVKACFAFGMGVNLLVVFSTTIYSCSTFREDTMLCIMLFIGVFNSMIMFMFHDTTAKKEYENGQRPYFSHKFFENPQSFQVIVDQEQKK